MKNEKAKKVQEDGSSKSAAQVQDPGEISKGEERVLDVSRYRDWDEGKVRSALRNDLGAAISLLTLIAENDQVLDLVTQVVHGNLKQALKNQE